MAKKQSHRHKKIEKKDIIEFILIAVVTAAVLFCAVMGIRWWENSQYANNNASVNEDILDAKEIEYNGVTYKQRRKVSSYLFIGVDHMDEVSASDDIYFGGQGDVQMILVIDDLNRTWRILQLNRDTMCDVPVLGVTGEVVGSEFEQLCLAHSYGSGMEDSCVNNVNAVSALLEDQSIDGYFSLNMGAIGIVNNVVGGVTVTIDSDFSQIDPSLVQGTTVTLTDEQAYEYVHSRKDVDDQTNLARMQRQRQYMDGVLQNIENQDVDFATKLYDALSEYMVTDIESGTASKLFTKIKEYTKLDLVTIDGNNVVENESWAYYLDDTSKMDTIIDLFYEAK